MKLTVIKKMMILGVAVAAFSSCAKDLNLSPQNAQLPSQVYSSAAGYTAVLAKIYGTLSIAGNEGPAGEPDITGGLDEGSQIALIRGLFNYEELTTDEAVESWNDGGVLDNIHTFSITNTDKFVYGMYARPIYNITLINEYLRESTDGELAANGITGQDAINIRQSRGEARFLRAFNYWVMLDLFGKSTFITENSPIGATPPEISRPALFRYIVDELHGADSILAPVKTAEYGRVDQGAEWALLARLYLNAAVYTPATATSADYDSAIIYSSKVIAGGYSLQPNYAQLFMADNDKRKDEFMFTINCDGLHTQGYGNTTFIVHCAAGSDNLWYGISGGWAGYRATSGLANLFPTNISTGDIDTTDKRALFTTYSSNSIDSPVVFGTSPGQIAIAATNNFLNGLHVAKFRNVRSDSAATNDPTGTFVDVDFPVFRLSEMYLIYAEAVLRGGAGGSNATALSYFNLIRERAYGHAGVAGTGDFVSMPTLQDVLDERGRELYWECQRRTDLIRYGLLTTGSYLWPWKGGVSSGTAVNADNNLLPIPELNILANPNLTQNPGY